MNATPRIGPLSRAIDQQSAEWLEMVHPAIFDALMQELAAGKSLEDIRKILRRKFADDLRQPFAARIEQAAEHLSWTDQAGV